MSGMDAYCVRCGAMTSCGSETLCKVCRATVVAEEKLALLEGVMSAFIQKVIVDCGTPAANAFRMAELRWRAAGFVERAYHTKVCKYEDRAVWCLEQLLLSLQEDGRGPKEVLS